VKKNSPAVVNISTVGKKSEGKRNQSSRDDDINQFFERFFGPNDRRRNPAPKRSLGSGFIISSDGYLLTNNHVVADAETIIVRFSDRRELNAKLVGADVRSDLALLKVEATDLPSVLLGSSTELEVGDWVLAIGSPFGFDYSVTAGIVSAKGRSVPNRQNENYVPFIQTDVAINPGNSGGPLFNLDGEVVGINSQIYSNSGGYMGVSFAIPIDVAMEVVGQLKTSGSVSRGWLGVRIQEVNRDLAESFSLDRPHGALVVDVLPNSPAELGGILAGDVITGFDGQSIDFAHELPHLVGRALAEDKVVLTIVRDGNQTTLKMRLGELPNTGAEKLVPEVEEIESSRIGLRVEPIDERVRNRFNINGGVRVLSSVGAAADAGLKPGDIISTINHIDITDMESFQVAVDGLPYGKSVPILIIRAQGRKYIALKVPE
tara:strand:- start:493 stop:1788 length:1296 start_codon:yes stop_codon:yes gene_type:complete